MIIDFHTHLFPQEIREHRENYVSAEPAFSLLYSSSKSKTAGAAELIQAMDENHVDKSVVFGFPWLNSETLKRHNDYIMGVVAKHPHRLIGLGCLNPANSDALVEAERCIEGGLAGIGELAFYQSGIDESVLNQLTSIMQLCQNRQLPVLIHTNEPIGHHYPGKTPLSLAQIYRLIKEFPKNKIVLAHWGGGVFFYSLLKKEVRAYLKNVYVDTAASPYLYDPLIYELAIKLIGVDKILFGSDYPLLPPSRYFDELQETGLTPSQVDHICGENARLLLKC
ncbi:MAG: TatD family hydrolase [Desulfobacterales bacterium]|jgi:hypothetical protein